MNTDNRDDGGISDRTDDKNGDIKESIEGPLGEVYEMYSALARRLSQTLKTPPAIIDEEQHEERQTEKLSPISNHFELPWRVSAPLPPRPESHIDFIPERKPVPLPAIKSFTVKQPDSVSVVVQKPELVSVTVQESEVEYTNKGKPSSKDSILKRMQNIHMPKFKMPLLNRANNTTLKADQFDIPEEPNLPVNVRPARGTPKCFRLFDNLHVKRRKLFVGLGLGLLFVIIVLFALFFPRAMTIKIRGKTETSEDYLLSTIDGMVTVNVTDSLKAILQNPNLYTCKVQNINVKASWVSSSSSKKYPDFALPDEVEDIDEFSISARGSKEIELPYRVDFTGDPATDPLYIDFLERCTNADRTKRMVRLDFRVLSEARCMGVLRRGVNKFSYKVPCPMTPEQIRAILVASGMDLKDRAVNKVQHNFDIQDQLIEKRDEEIKKEVDEEVRDEGKPEQDMKVGTPLVVNADENRIPSANIILPKKDSIVDNKVKEDTYVPDVTEEIEDGDDPYLVLAFDTK